MSKQPIGFTSPPNPDKQWQKEMAGQVCTYIKRFDRRTGVFVYACKRGNAQTGFRSNRDLTPEEVEQLPQFDHFRPRA